MFCVEFVDSKKFHTVGGNWDTFLENKYQTGKKF